MLANLMASGGGHISTAVALEDDPEPVVGSFTVDGLTYAIVGEGEVALVAVDPDAVALAVEPSGTDGEGRGVGSGVPSRSVAEQVPSGAASPQPQPSPSVGASAQGDPAGEAATDGAAFPAEGGIDGSGSEGSQGPAVLSIPESVEFDGMVCSVVAIGPRAFAGCDADVVRVPTSVESVDELALRGSAVAFVEVVDGNPSFSSYDGMLFDADQLRLLLVPEGKQGAARIPKTAETVPPDAFSHCASVTSVTVDAGSAAFTSRNGCLYDATGRIVLWMQAGADDDGGPLFAGGTLIDQLESQGRFAAGGPIVHVDANDGYLVKVDLTAGIEETVAVSYDEAINNWSLLGNGSFIQYARATDGHLIRITPRRTSYRFVFWESFSAGQDVTGDYSQYFRARWEPLPYIQLDGNGGDLQISDENGAFRTALSTLSTHLTGTNWAIQAPGYFCATGEGVFGYGMVVNPVRAGYRFEGWKALGSRETDSVKIEYPYGGYYSGAETIQIACLWHRINTVTLDGNGGDVLVREMASDVVRGMVDRYVGTSTGKGWNLQKVGRFILQEDQANREYVQVGVEAYRSRHAFLGWSTFDRADGEDLRLTHERGRDYSGNHESPVEGQDVLLYARWAPIIAIEAPVDLDIKMDVLGVEAQQAGAGRIVSRTDGPLEVVEAACEPVVESAKALFGWGGQDESRVSLTVRASGAPEDAASPSFPLGSPSTETDSSTLALFALPDGYGSELALSYGLAMPEGYAVPASYPQQRTPIAKFTYTVRLAREAAAGSSVG